MFEAAARFPPGVQEPHTSKGAQLVTARRSSYVDRMTLWHALTQTAAHRPPTAPSCPVSHGHHPLPVTCRPLPIAPITLHSCYWLKAPQLPLKSPHCTVYPQQSACSLSPT